VYVSRVVDLLSEAKSCPGESGGVCQYWCVGARVWVLVLVFVGVSIACMHIGVCLDAGACVCDILGK
jgi:hypothetical protein